MQHKFLLILPISIIGLLSCMPDSTPKSLSYEETLSYINNNYKELTGTPTGYVEYACESVGYAGPALEALGVVNPKEPGGANQIDEDKFVKKYINNSSDETMLQSNVSLSLMFLSPSNFPIFVDNGANYSYQLTYVKELIVTSTISTNVTYKRYYNTSLHLTRFEIDSKNVDEEKVFTATQTFIY